MDVNEKALVAFREAAARARQHLPTASPPRGDRPATTERDVAFLDSIARGNGHLSPKQAAWYTRLVNAMYWAEVRRHRINCPRPQRSIVINGMVVPYNSVTEMLGSD